MAPVLPGPMCATSNATGMSAGPANTVVKTMEPRLERRGIVKGIINWTRDKLSRDKPIDPHSHTKPNYQCTREIPQNYPPYEYQIPNRVDTLIQGNKKPKTNRDQLFSESISVRPFTPAGDQAGTMREAARAEARVQADIDRNDKRVSHWTRFFSPGGIFKNWKWPPWKDTGKGGREVQEEAAVLREEMERQRAISRGFKERYERPNKLPLPVRVHVEGADTPVLYPRPDQTQYETNSNGEIINRPSHPGSVDGPSSDTSDSDIMGWADGCKERMNSGKGPENGGPSSDTSDSDIMGWADGFNERMNFGRGPDNGGPSTGQRRPISNADRFRKYTGRRFGSDVTDSSPGSEADVENSDVKPLVRQIGADRPFGGGRPPKGIEAPQPMFGWDSFSDLRSDHASYGSAPSDLSEASTPAPAPAPAAEPPVKSAMSKPSSTSKWKKFLKFGKPKVTFEPMEPPEYLAPMTVLSPRPESYANSVELAATGYYYVERPLKTGEKITKFTKDLGKKAKVGLKEAKAGYKEVLRKINGRPKVNPERAMVPYTGPTEPEPVTPGPAVLRITQDEANRVGNWEPRVLPDLPTPIGEFDPPAPERLLTWAELYSDPKHATQQGAHVSDDSIHPPGPLSDISDSSTMTSNLAETVDIYDPEYVNQQGAHVSGGSIHPDSSDSSHPTSNLVGTPDIHEPAIQHQAHVSGGSIHPDSTDSSHPTSNLVGTPDINEPAIQHQAHVSGGSIHSDSSHLTSNLVDTPDSHDLEPVTPPDLEDQPFFWPGPWDLELFWRGRKGKKGGDTIKPKMQHGHEVHPRPNIPGHAGGVGENLHGRMMAKRGLPEAVDVWGRAGAGELAGGGFLAAFIILVMGFAMVKIWKYNAKKSRREVMV